MKPIGGELPIQRLNEDIYFTDSGRSSLRLFIRSGNKGKKFLIPNFLCEVIENIMVEENIQYEFYNILEDLTIDLTSLINKQFDVFYSINYFGQLQHLENIGLENMIVIEDNIFFYDFENRNNFKYWLGFNSFRKISSLADGSMIKTNLDIDSSQIKKREAEFIQNKYQAKNMKYDYLFHDIGDEQDYISLFDKGEAIINHQSEIYQISEKSNYLLMNYEIEKEQEVSKKYFLYMTQKFENECINKDASYYSFFIIKVSNRDNLRKFLFSKNIFLPIHWPKSTQSNKLYASVISIPLFGRYTFDEIKNIINNIKEFYENN